MSPVHDDTLSMRERQIMDAVYRLEQATVAEIRDQLPDPPTANADSATTDEDAAVSISPLENDVDIDLDDTFAMVSVGDAEHGSVTADVETGAVSYTPAPNYFGEDSFTYTLTDQRRWSIRANPRSTCLPRTP